MTALARQLPEAGHGARHRAQPAAGALRALQSLPGIRTARELSRPQPTYPVEGPLAPVFAHGGLPRGRAVGVTGGHALTVALAGAARATAEGSWCATVGVGEPSVAACLDLGLDPGHYVNVMAPGADWLRAVSILVESMDIVIARPPFRLTPGERQRLLAKVRERRMSLIVLGELPGTAEALTTGVPTWRGTRHGAGRLRECAVRVHSPVTGDHDLLLPGPGGGVQGIVDAEAAPSAAVPAPGGGDRVGVGGAASPAPAATGARPRLVVRNG